MSSTEAKQYKEKPSKEYLHASDGDDPANNSAVQNDI